jgi:oligopeptide/dipeptide ABC transporter ATP-binding protein
LLNSVPVFGRKGEKVLVPIEGMVPSSAEEIPGCSYADRCPRVMKVCRAEEPALREVEPGHQVACWLYGGR